MMSDRNDDAGVTARNKEMRAATSALDFYIAAYLRDRWEFRVETQ